MNADMPTDEFFYKFLICRRKSKIISVKCEHTYDADCLALKDWHHFSFFSNYTIHSSHQLSPSLSLSLFVLWSPFRTTYDKSLKIENSTLFFLCTDNERGVTMLKA